MSFGKAGCVGYISDLQGAASGGVDPQALGAVLQHNGRAGLVIRDGSVNPDSLGEILYMIAGKNPVQRRYRDGPRTDAGALQNLDVRKRGDVKVYPCLLHLVVEF